MMTRILVPALALAAACTAASANVGGGEEALGGGGSGIAFSSEAQPFGRNLAEWGQRWWQWIYRIPASQNPILDATGASCAVGQDGPVWFLASVIDPGGVASFERSCTLPADKAVLVSPSGSLND